MCVCVCVCVCVRACVCACVCARERIMCSATLSLCCIASIWEDSVYCFLYMLEKTGTLVRRATIRVMVQDNHLPGANTAVGKWAWMDFSSATRSPCQTQLERNNYLRETLLCAHSHPDKYGIFCVPVRRTVSIAH